MNIGLFSETYYPEINGVATSVYMLKEYLERAGHSVFVFTTTNPLVRETEDGVFRVPSVPFRVRRLGIFINPRLKSIIRGLGLDVVHTHTEFSLGIFGRSVAKSLNLPFIHTMHTIYEEYTNYIFDFERFKLDRLSPAAKAAARRLTASFCNSADAVVAPTAKTKELLLSYGVIRNISVVPTGISLEKFDAVNCGAEKIRAIKSEYGIQDNEKTLVYIGRISKEKNLDEILRYMGSYMPERPDVKLLIVGDGPARESLESLAAELGIAQRVIFAGIKPWDDIGNYYRAGDVFVSASQSETQGLTYIEAIASGLPVVAKRDRCLEDVLKEGVNGYSFIGKESFSAALDKILYNQGVLESMSKNAEQSAAAFSAVTYASLVESLYKSVCAQNKYKSVS